MASPSDSLHEHSEACYHALLHPFFSIPNLVLRPVDAYLPLYWKLIFSCSEFDEAFSNFSPTVEHEEVHNLLKGALLSHYHDFDHVRRRIPNTYRIPAPILTVAWSHTHEKSCNDNDNENIEFVKMINEKSAEMAIKFYWRIIFQCSYFKPTYQMYMDGEEHVEVHALLANAIKTGNYSLDTIRQQVPASYCARRPSSLTAMNAADPAVLQSFEAEFIGNSHLTFLKTLDQYYRDSKVDEVYSLSTSLVQSSCTGKSRVTYEAAKVRLTILMNIREVLPDQYAYPPSDEVVYGFLVGDRQESMERKILLYSYHCFLAALFSVMCDRLDILPPGESIALDWHTFMESDRTPSSPSPNRCNFFEDVVSRAKKLELLRTTPQHHKEARRLLRHAKKHAGNDEAPVVIVIDEAHPLASKNTSDGRSFLRVMEHALGSLKDLGIFTVFLSTNSKIEALTPPTKRHPSYRGGGNMGVLIPPLTEFGEFDLFLGKAADLLRSGSLTLNRLLLPEYIVSFGRAQWRAMFAEDSPHDSEKRLDRVISFAKKKLNPSRLNHTSLVAWLAIRLLLNADSTSDPGRHLQSVLVESYLRIAAAQLVHASLLTDRPPNLFQVLGEYLKKGILAKGERGELVSRLLMILAHDAATKHSVPGLVSPLRYHRPVSLLAFLEALLQPDVYQLVRKALPVYKNDDNDNPVPLETAFVDAYLHFSHFVLAGDYKIVEDTHLRNFFLRGAAVQCRDNQVGIDAIAPMVFVNDADTPIYNSATSALQVQVKNRKVAQDLIVPTHLTRTESQSHERPLLSLVLELGSPNNGVTFPSISPSSTRAPPFNYSHYHQLANLLAISRDFESAFPRLSSLANERLLMQAKPHWVADSKSPASMGLFSEGVFVPKPDDSMEVDT
ncbi:hypothetical protein C8J57DRAFT_1704923 [Mycena rebaudengoi]|nr:hypothetical protein C8J57DRAFT_1704923 [Mycena rebaudengoi]